MEINQTPPPPPGPLFQLNIDANAQQTLRSAASWSKVLGIFGVLLGVLFFILGLLMQSASKSNAEFGENAALMRNAGMVVYIIFGLLLIIGSIFSLNFGNKINTALRSNDQYSLSAGFAAARNYFAFWAILCIIFLLLFILTIFQLATR
jgi:magnesium-transporting ATPase (P-type)